MTKATPENMIEQREWGCNKCFCTFESQSHFDEHLKTMCRKSRPMSVDEIVATWLKANGYDGLMQEDGECGCLVSDLALCGEEHGSCVAGHKEPCNKDCSHDYQRDDEAWHITTMRPK